MSARKPPDPVLLVLAWCMFRELGDKFFTTPAGLVVTITLCLIILRLVSASCTR